MTAYDKDTTTNEILDGLDLSGRSFVVTGASSGLGTESARVLAAHGASVTMLARDNVRNAEAANAIRADHPDAELELGQVDLADLSSIRAFADDYLAGHDKIDVLMNNPGVMACPKTQTADGFEMQFGTNHLGHFFLTSLLAPAIQAGDAPRVVTLSSAAHGNSDVNLDDPNFEVTAYDPWGSYGRSKTANALFARELAKRSNGAILSFSVHPGGIKTNLGRHLNDELMAEMMERIEDRAEAAGEPPAPFAFKTLEAGAATQVWGATGQGLDAHNGAYLADCRVGALGVNIGSYGIEPYLLDDASAARLWAVSEEMVGQAFELG